MGIFEIISAVLLILACILIVGVVLAQDTKQGMSQTVTGSSADNYYQKNAGRSKEAQLKKITLIAVVAFFAISIFVNLASRYFAGTDDETSGNASVTTAATTIEETTAAETTEAETTVAEVTTE